jgi:hypothetical protein
MQAGKEASALPEIGSFGFEVHGAGRGRSSRFVVRCDAIGLHEHEILLLSIVGPETSVKALTAGLRASGTEQARLEYSVRVGTVDRRGLCRCPEGYRIYRARMDFGLWHLLCLARKNGFLPVLTEEAVWQRLQSEPFTTPLLRAWMPWLCPALKEQGALVELTQCGCQAGLLLADNDTLDAVVSAGLQEDHLRLPGCKARSADRARAAVPESVKTLDQYLVHYGPLLGKRAARSLEPLHVPGRDPLPVLHLLREPFEAQAHVIEAARKALCRQKALLLVGEMGVGKTLMGLAAIHAHASGRPYRALVFCPGQLVHKWEREIRATLAGVEVVQIATWKNLLHLSRANKPERTTWYILARDRAKLGAKWRPAYQQRPYGEDGWLRCPQCGRRLVDDQRLPLAVGRPGQGGQPGTGLWKRRARCTWVLTNSRSLQDSQRQEGDHLVPGCGSPLWTMTGELWRYEPALYVKRRLPHFFHYLILDEVHEEKGLDTAQGHAAAALAVSCRKVIALTGTLIGGYAEHLRPLLFRLAPASLVQEGLGWSEAMAFNERYGRLETRITERSSTSAADNRMSRGSRSTTRSLRPGVMPALFGRHLMDKAVFLGLSEVADNLPPLEEECLPVTMDPELARAYRHEVEEPLAAALKAMLRSRNKRLLGTMVQTLLAYPDYPYGWGPIGYWQGGVEGSPRVFVTVAVPPNLAEAAVRPKEQALLDLVASEKARGRKVWVYVQFTSRHDVQGRVARLLHEAGFQVGVLRADVPLARREEWIARYAPGLDVVVSHPRLVETGLDLFAANGSYNFSTLCFYETGYNLFTLRQASRRSWRIGQKQDCRIVYLYYAGTMQDRAMALMGKKLTAAQALEGTFAREGLVALAGEDANVELALARSLVECLDEGDARRVWSKVHHPQPPSEKSPDSAKRQRSHVGPRTRGSRRTPVPALDLLPLAAPGRSAQGRQSRQTGSSRRQRFRGDYWLFGSQD